MYLKMYIYIYSIDVLENCSIEKSRAFQYLHAREFCKIILLFVETIRIIGLEPKKSNILTSIYHHGQLLNILYHKIDKKLLKIKTLESRIAFNLENIKLAVTNLETIEQVPVYICDRKERGRGGEGG